MWSVVDVLGPKSRRDGGLDGCGQWLLCCACRMWSVVDVLGAKSRQDGLWTLDGWSVVDVLGPKSRRDRGPQSPA